MFLKKLYDTNREFIESAFQLFNEGTLEPDTLVLDYSTFKENGEKLIEEANTQGLKLYFMTKQIGRNPLIAKMLMDLGFDGAVCVDAREAEVLGKEGIALGNVGHLVQTPTNMMEQILSYQPEYMTVYTLEKIKQINDVAKKLGIVQKIMLRIVDDTDFQYQGQDGGIEFNQIELFIDRYIDLQLEYVYIDGITSFPCFLYDEETNQIQPTKNIHTLHKAKEIIEHKLNKKLHMINLPSCTCTSTIKNIVQYGGTHGEPGHGISGTTPMHVNNDLEEKISYLYISEVSHNYQGHSYLYGGGYYRRSHIKEGLAMVNGEYIWLDVEEPNMESIDYYFRGSKELPVGAPVIMCFRTQGFVTRSYIAVLERDDNASQIIGKYDSGGRALE